MGLFRTLYREIRDILGMKPPPENDAQRTERICGEARGDLGGKRAPAEGGWTLTTALEGRGLRIFFEIEGGRALMEVDSELGPGPAFTLVVDSTDSVPPGHHRRQVGTSLYLDATDEAALETFDQMWKALPTGTRGNLTSLLQKSSGTLRYREGAFSFIPEVALLTAPGARSQVRTQAMSLGRLVSEMEQTWSQL